MTARIFLIDGKARPQHYEELRRCYAAQWLDAISEDALPDPRSFCDLAMISDEFASQYSRILCTLVRHQVPTVHVVDGILEWRNCWGNPRSLKPDHGMPLFQPILSHKVACLGRSQARLLESWGNLGKCEVVGSPRFDSLHGRTPRKRTANEPFQILVMTAKTPGFTCGQLARAKESLWDVKTWFERNRRVGTTEVRPIWRITAGLEHEIGVRNELRETTGADLADALQHVDAVITTPSTAMLEGMLQGVPVALLDYNNSPHYVPAAWRIAAQRNMDQVLPEMIHPPAAKMLYQDTILHDALECRSPATPRMVCLVEEMIRIGQDCRARNVALELPRRILPDEQDGHHLPEERFDLRELYPDHPVFSDMDRAARQVELGHLQVLARRNHERIVALQQQNRALQQSLARFHRHPLLGQLLRIRRKMIGLWGRKSQPQHT